MHVVQNEKITKYQINMTTHLTQRK